MDRGQSNARHSTKAWNTGDQPDDASYNEFSIDDLPEVALTGHQWVQRGQMLECTSCAFKHGAVLSVDYQLYGMDDEGKPMIRKINVKD